MEALDPNATFDVIVVGGGSSGCVVAGRVAAAAPSLRVLLLEAGQRATDNPETLRADGYREAFVNDALMWERDSVPMPGLGGRRAFLGSGRGMGGSGAINAMVYTRGSAADYAAWQLPTWDWASVTPDFEALESHLGIDRHPPTEFGEACIEAACRAGFQRSEDLNDGHLDGVLGYEWMNFRGDRRRNSWAAFVQDAPDHLTVHTGVRVHRVDLDPDARTTRGVVYSLEADTAGTERTVGLRPGGHVVLCAGALETPKLLALSGVGPASVVQRVGRPLIAAREEVGANLQDHPNVSIFYQGTREVDATTPQVYGFHRADPNSSLPPEQADTCYVFYPARSSFREGLMRMLPTMALPPSLRSPRLVHGMRSGIRKAFEQAPVHDFIARMWGIVVILGKPRSRGTVRPSSPDPRAVAHVDPAWFADPHDLDTLVRGIELARRIAASTPLSQWQRRELMPGGWARSREALASFVRRNAMTTYHYGGTCRMGADESSVVDPELRVRGVDGLLVADASVMPVVPVSALNAPSMLIGWRAADTLLAR